MSRINPEDYLDYEEVFGQEQPAGSKRRGKATKADKEQRKREREEINRRRAIEARKKISLCLRRFLHLETHEGRKQKNLYLRWLLDSFGSGFSSVGEKDLEIKATLPKVKAGGQHHQKNMTAAVAIHKPSLIFVRNEEERSFEQNFQMGKKILLAKAESHFKLWQIIKRDLLGPFDLEKEITSLLSIK